MAENACYDNVYLIRKQVGELAGALDCEIHSKASGFAEWLTSSIGHCTEGATSESNHALQPDGPPC